MNLYESVQPVAGCFFPVWRKTLLYREAALERARRGRRGAPTGSPRGGGNTLERSPSVAMRSLTNG